MRIAYGVFHLRDGPLKNWQYLFIIEGTLTILFGLIAWVFLPAGPGSAWFLTQEERRFAADRIKADSVSFTEHAYDAHGVETDRLTQRDFIETARDWKFCKERGYHILGGIIIAVVGLVATVTVESNGGKYAALCVLLLGSYVAAPLTVAWLSGNTPEPGKRSLILGLNGFGNLSGVIGAQLYRDRYKPGYKIPFYVTLGFVAVSLLGYFSYRLTLAAVNRRKLELMRQKSAEEIERERLDNTRYADKKWTFIYGL
ncbi:hypothetical protein COL516b_006605 [Colletotrichum fioriniae]|nr:uncharacterized protein COL516b_006605 [Colletotrichum fioriniae]KAJ0303094.1 hypothetical protein COL516b_006605 [Colletotrichum fioriniae]